MNTKICCIFDQAAHYRAPIYKLMDRELNCDFYITKWKKNPFKQMDYSELKGLKMVSYNKKIFGNFFWQSRTVRLAFQPYNNYLMIGQPYSLSTWVLIIILKLLKKNCYLWSHGWYGDESKIKIYIKKIFFSFATATFLYGDYARNLMIKQGIKQNKLICIYNSLDYEMQKEIRSKIKSSDIYYDYFKNRYPVLLYIGRIQKIKKIDLLLKAIYELKEDGFHCNLIIIGEQTEELNINSLINEFGLKENVWMFGACYDEKIIGELIYNADLCVSPGNVGLTAMHSLVYGTPVLTHNNFANQMPEFEAVKEGVTGGFFEENSIKDMSEKIKYWTSLTSSERDKVRNNCYEIIDKKYNPNIQIKILTETIR
jgi:glycosyltransferase involved in cell wall biosynthesis